MSESNVFIMDHPLIQHKIGFIRRKETGTKEFRNMISEIAMLICYEASRHLELVDVDIETPICKTTVKELAGPKLCVVPILRAHIGLYRDPETLKPVEYFCKLPQDCEEREVFVVDPMLATGGSASAAITMLKNRGCKHISFLCVLATQEGIDRLTHDHPDIRIFIGIKDKQLNEKGYIVPGLGDAGDRIFGTL